MVHGTMKVLYVASNVPYKAMRSFLYRYSGIMQQQQSVDVFRVIVTLKLPLDYSNMYTFSTYCT